MSTNSRIGILHEDGTTETIYCHWDGYPEHQMPILTKHYDTAEKVKKQPKKTAGKSEQSL